MPKGPKGERRPADVIGNAVHIMRIATGEIEDTKTPKNETAAASGREGGKKGGKIRAARMSAEERRQAASRAAKARWRKS